MTMAYREYAKTDGEDSFAPSYMISTEGETGRNTPLTDLTGLREGKDDDDEVVELVTRERVTSPV